MIFDGAIVAALFFGNEMRKRISNEIILTYSRH